MGDLPGAAASAHREMRGSTTGVWLWIPSSCDSLLVVDAGRSPKPAVNVFPISPGGWGLGRSPKVFSPAWPHGLPGRRHRQQAHREPPPPSLGAARHAGRSTTSRRAGQRQQQSEPPHGGPIWRAGEQGVVFYEPPGRRASERDSSEARRGRPGGSRENASANADVDSCGLEQFWIANFGEVTRV